MYLSLGAGKYVRKDELIGIFDLDITSQSYITRKFLNAAEKDGRLINATEDIPKSFAVTANRDLYLSQPSTATLIKRIEEEM